MNGHLEELKWARENDRCRVGQDDVCKTTCAYAARGGHLEVLKWARARIHARGTRDVRTRGRRDTSNPEPPTRETGSAPPERTMTIDDRDETRRPI